MAEPEQPIAKRRRSVGGSMLGQFGAHRSTPGGAGLPKARRGIAEKSLGPVPTLSGGPKSVDDKRRGNGHRSAENRGGGDVLQDPLARLR
jgi:hypothetical protein